MKEKIFVDTGAFLALLDASDPYHASAGEVFGNFHNSGAELCTIDYVLDELFTIMRCTRRLPVERVLAFANNIELADIEVFGISKDVFKDALKLMVKYSDQYFSMTDCVSFIVMKDLKIKKTLTTDKHFTIAGFNNLLWR